MNVALYGPGARRWAMTERGAATLAQTPDSIRIGPSRMVWDGDALIVEIDERAAPVPRRVRGRLRLTPEIRGRESFALDADGRHCWRPLAPLARVEADFDAPRLSWRGAGYIDSNWGEEPLESAFRSWNWARAPIGEGARGGAMVVYDAVPRAGPPRRLALRFGAKGAVRLPETPETRLPPGPIWRVARASRGPAPRIAQGLEDAPFYTRALVETEIDGETLRMTHESLDLDRFSRFWVRCLLPFRMPRQFTG